MDIAQAFEAWSITGSMPVRATLIKNNLVHVKCLNRIQITSQVLCGGSSVR